MASEKREVEKIESFLAIDVVNSFRKSKFGVGCRQSDKSFVCSDSYGKNSHSSGSLSCLQVLASEFGPHFR